MEFVFIDTATHLLKDVEKVTEPVVGVPVNIVEPNPVHIKPFVEYAKVLFVPLPTPTNKLFA
jgi:hypothetical protein